MAGSQHVGASPPQQPKAAHVRPGDTQAADLEQQPWTDLAAVLPGHPNCWRQQLRTLRKVASARQQAPMQQYSTWWAGRCGVAHQWGLDLWAAVFMLGPPQLAKHPCHSTK